VRVYFTNLGCKLNQAEVEKLAREFRAAGHEVVSSLEEADLHVINSCTVTHLAARDSRKIARRGRRINPNVRTILTGCYATAEPKEAARLAGVDLVVINDQKDRLLELVHRTFPDVVPKGRSADSLPVPCVPLEFGHTRAMVKVQDGCNMRCAFCIIPFTRGPERSRPLPEVVAEIRGLVEGGYREIVVTGVQISSYRINGDGLYELVTAILEQTEVPRLRLTSLAPWEFDERLLELWGDQRLCRHIHLSLQSGCTATLRRMRRPYTAEMYAAVVERIREAIPGVAVTTDVIVGFPGETPEEFDESLRFVERMQFAKVHVFPYSPRPGTEAATLPDQVPYPEKKARVEAMLTVAEESERRFWEQHLGQRLTVLWEVRKNGTWQGMTDNYIRVFGQSDRELTNTFTSVTLVKLADRGVFGEVGEDR